MPKKLAKLYHFDSFGKRQEKYDRLNNSEFSQVEWQELNPTEPYYFFVPKDFEAQKQYEKGFSVSEIFGINTSGIKTHRDKFIIDDSFIDLKNRLKEFYSSYNSDILNKFGLKETKEFNYDNIRKYSFYNEDFFKKISYKPFDNKNIYYSSNFIDRDRISIMKNMFFKNIGFIFRRTAENSNNWQQVFVSDKIIDINFLSAQTYFFPLYLYQENNLEGKEEKIPNFNMEIIGEIEKKLGLNFVASFSGEGERIQERGFVDFFPEDLFDYIYAVLHSKSYREKFKEFLKIDFPKIPFDVDKETFFKMRDLGRELRSWHLMENEKLIPKNFITKYPVSGDNLVEKIKYKNEKVFINDNQYFEGVPENVWNFYIGGYQPAQKWLKDRKERNLNYDDILHYSKIIMSLNETIKIMEKIEGIFRI